MADPEVVPQDTVAPVASEAGNTPPVEQAAPETVAAPEGEAEVDEGPKKQPWFMERIGELTRKKADEAEGRRKAEAELAVYKAMAEKGEQPEVTATVSGGMTTEAFEKAVEAKVAQKIAADTYQVKAQTWLKNGTTEFADFNDKCNVVAALGAADRPEFMQIVTGLDDGHKIVARMADNPEEAQRILSLSPLQMAVEIAKLSGAKPTPAKVAISNAPAPIRPVDGSAKATEEISGDEDMKDFAAKWRKKQATAKSNGFARF